MPTCPKGHQSADTDYCDECGTPIGARPTPAAPGNGSSPAPAAAPSAAGAGEPCPNCSTPRSDRFCEVCGHDFVAAQLSGAAGTPGAAAVAGTATPPVSEALPTRQPTVTPTWRAAVAADRDYHARMQAIADPDVEPIPFPAFCPERRFWLRGPQMLIGRQSRSRGIEPDIDLTGPPTDPAVSHAHAMLVAQPDGSWVLVDLGSSNGTYLNDGTEAIEENVPVPLSDGDRIHLGAFSTITVRRA